MKPVAPVTMTFLTYIRYSGINELAFLVLIKVKVVIVG